jgi:glycosyltransferase involved in cell wall biosynthesis
MAYNLSLELKNQSHEVIVVSLYNYHSSITDRLEQSDIPVRYLGKRKGMDIRMIFRLYTLFRKEKPDVIHTHRYVMEYAIPAAVLAGVQVRIHTIHNVAKKENTTLARKLNKLFFRFFHVIPVSLSEEVQKTVMLEYDLSEAQTPVIFNGVPLERCKPLKTYSSHAERFFHVGRFSEAKNHAMLICAFVQAHEQDSNLHLYLYGQGELDQSMRGLVKEKRAESYIHFCGLSDDIYTIMHNMDLFLLPSLYEGMPMTLIEAMGTGLPIITTNVGGIPDMLQNNESAVMISPDERKLTTAIVSLANSQSRREKLGRSALEVSVGFSSQGMAKSYLSLYETRIYP